MDTFIAPLLASIVGAIAGSVATWRYLHRSAKKVTLDFVATYELHSAQPAIFAIAYLRNLSPEDCESLAKRWSNSEIEKSEIDSIANVASWLNLMELVSVGVLNKSLHRKTYFDCVGEQQFKQRWNIARPFVSAIRREDLGEDYLCTNFEKLADTIK